MYKQRRNSYFATTPWLFALVVVIMSMSAGCSREPDKIEKYAGPGVAIPFDHKLAGIIDDIVEPEGEKDEECEDWSGLCEPYNRKVTVEDIVERLGKYEKLVGVEVTPDFTFPAESTFLLELYNEAAYAYSLENKCDEAVNYAKKFAELSSNENLVAVTFWTQENTLNWAYVFYTPETPNYVETKKSVIKKIATQNLNFINDCDEAKTILSKLAKDEVQTGESEKSDLP